MQERICTVSYLHTDGWIGVGHRSTIANRVELSPEITCVAFRNATDVFDWILPIVQSCNAGKVGRISKQTYLIHIHAFDIPVTV